MFKKDPLQIIAFQTYGTKNRLYLRGRAIEDENIDLEQKGAFKSFFNAWKRFKTDEIKNTTIKVTIGNQLYFYTKTDNRGYFLFDKQVKNLNQYASKNGWVPLVFSYKNISNKRHIQLNNTFISEMLIPNKAANFGVITDIDDTILHTGIVSILKWRVLYNTLLTAAGKRIPLDGTPEFYHLLHQGKTKNNINPIFYVSHSPWNLYRYLDYFLKKNNFPKGPIILRNFPKLFSKKKKNDIPQKQKEIINLLKSYPELNFILIGDSGEHDPDIYMEITKQYPNRILAIYLRSVNHSKKMGYVKTLYKNFKLTQMLLVYNSNDAITHAKLHGFIAH